MNGRMLDRYTVDATPLEDIKANQNEQAQGAENQVQEEDEAESSELPQINISQAYIAHIKNVRDDIAG